MRSRVVREFIQTTGGRWVDEDWFLRMSPATTYWL
jgi:hypothetical protein